MLGVTLENRSFQDEVRRDGTALLSAAAEVPACTGGASVRSRVTFNRHYLGLAQTWMADARGPMAMAALRHRNRNRAAGVPFEAHTARLHAEVVYNTTPWVSVVCDARRTESAVHDVTERTAQTWDLSAGHIATLRDLFQPGYDYLKTIFDYIERHDHLPAEAVQTLRERFRSKDFYLTRKGIAVFFPLAETQPGAADIPVHVIPYQEFEGLRL